MSGKKNLVKVTIAGEEYSLRSDRSDEYTRAVADHVDVAMREIMSGGAMVETQKAAILAALAVTDELFQSRLGAREMEQRLANLTAALSRFLPPRKRPHRGGEPFASAPEHR
jgi:cell division protein ZapA